MAATAVRVFGKPITNGTRIERALAAKKYPNANGKLDQVLKEAGTVSTTIGRVYNATGETVTFVSAYDWEGNVSGEYPVSIQNGQWAVFEHVGTRSPVRLGSVAASVFTIVDTFDSMISWNNPWKTSEGNSNTAYCEMNVPGYFDESVWDAIHEKLLASDPQSQTSREGYSTKVSIEAGGNTPISTAYFYLEV